MAEDKKMSPLETWLAGQGIALGGGIGGMALGRSVLSKVPKISDSDLAALEKSYDAQIKPTGAKVGRGLLGAMGPHYAPDPNVIGMPKGDVNHFLHELGHAQQNADPKSIGGRAFKWSIDQQNKIRSGMAKNPLATFLKSIPLGIIDRGVSTPLYEADAWRRALKLAPSKKAMIKAAIPAWGSYALMGAGTLGGAGMTGKAVYDAISGDDDDMLL